MTTVIVIIALNSFFILSCSGLKCFSCQLGDYPPPGANQSEEIPQCPSSPGYGTPNDLALVTCSEENNVRCGTYSELDKDKVLAVFRGCVDTVFCTRIKVIDSNHSYNCQTCLRNSCNGFPISAVAISKTTKQLNTMNICEPCLCDALISSRSGTITAYSFAVLIVISILKRRFL